MSVIVRRTVELRDSDGDVVEVTFDLDRTVGDVVVPWAMVAGGAVHISTSDLLTFCDELRTWARDVDPDAYRAHVTERRDVDPFYSPDAATPDPF